MIVFYTNKILQHQPKEFLSGNLITAHECPERIVKILQTFYQNPEKWQFLTPIDKGLEGIYAIHAEQYITYLQTIYQQWCQAGGSPFGVLPECIPHFKMLATNKKPKDIFALPGYYSFDQSTFIDASSWTSIYWSAQTAINAADYLIENFSSHLSLFALLRPPGHHCSRDLAGGYCYLNNAAIAAERIITKSNKNVTILDLDFHHGNGTQDIFYDRKNPCYISLHGQDEYPYYSGYDNEKGVGEGLGYNINIPIDGKKNHVDDDYYLQILQQVFENIKIPEVLIISLGLDTFIDDPLGNFHLTTQGYTKIGQLIAKKINHEIPILIILEGGYHLEKIGENVSCFLEAFNYFI